MKLTFQRIALFLFAILCIFTIYKCAKGFIESCYLARQPVPTVHTLDAKDISSITALSELPDTLAIPPVPVQPNIAPPNQTPFVLSVAQPGKPPAIVIAFGWTHDLAEAEAREVADDLGKHRELGKPETHKEEVVDKESGTIYTFWVTHLLIELDQVLVDPADAPALPAKAKPGI